MQQLPLALLDADVSAWVNAQVASQVASAVSALTAQITKKNYALNSAMMVNQEGATVTTTGGYIVDQFIAQFVNGGAISGVQAASTTPGGSPNRLRVTVTTADAAVAAGDYSLVAQPIEGYRVADLLWGTASAKSITVRFGVRAPAGTYCVVALNSALNRSYVAEYTITGGEANTDVVKSVTIPGDTSGTWLANNGVGMWVRWGLMAGTTFQQAAGAWGTTSAVGSANQFNFMGTLANVFELFDVAVTEGTSAPPFVVPDPITEKLRCQRYYYKILPAVTGAGIAAGLAYSTTLMIYAITFPVEMRANPTATLSALGWRTGGNSGAITTISASNAGTTGTELQLNLSGGPPVAGHGSVLEATSGLGYIAFNARY